MWLFCKNQVNPLWLTVTVNDSNILIQNKHLIKCGVVMNLNFGLNLESSQYLSSFSQKDKIVYFKEID